MNGTCWQCGLLVSVRDASEAEVAAAAGAAIVDVKEPARGPLGRADAAAAAAVTAVVAGRAAVTLAGGELAAAAAPLVRHTEEVLRLLPPGVAPPVAVKAGPAGISQADWITTFRQLADALPAGIEPVAVAYADWRAAAAPTPGEILDAAAAAGAATVLVDTFNKSGLGLFGIVTDEEVQDWLARARAGGMALAVAGRLGRADVSRALRLGVDVVGVRSAACIGGRQGRVDATRVLSLGTLFRSVTVPPALAQRRT